MAHFIWSVLVAVGWAYLAYDGIYNRSKMACFWLAALVGWAVFVSMMENEILAAFIKGLGL